MGEPISRWLALLVTVASLPLACITLAIGLCTQSSAMRGIGLGWLGVLGLLTVVVQICVDVLNRQAARSTALPRAWTATRKLR